MTMKHGFGSSICQCFGYAVMALGTLNVSAQQKPAPTQDTSGVALLEPVDKKYLLGERMLLTLTYSNRSDKPIRLAESTWWDWDFPIAKLDIADSAGHPVPRRQAGYERYDRFNGSAKLTEVPAKAEKKWQINLADKFVLTNTGAYSVSALVSIPEQNGSKGPTRIKTPQAKFEIVPPATNPSLRTPSLPPTR